DIVRVDVLAAADDHVLLAIDEIEVALLVHPAHVAEREPLAVVALASAFGIVEVAGKESRAAHEYLTHLAHGHFGARIVENSNLHVAYGPPHGALLALELRGGDVGDDARLGRPVELVQDRAEARE